MSLDINRKIIQKNAFRITKKRNKTAIRIRVPGGHLQTKYFSIIAQIAEEYGNGSVHITTRQGFEIPDIDFKFITEVNKLLAPLINGLECSIGVSIDNPEDGYPAAGIRNISACIGNRVCPFANLDTTNLALKMEKEVYPNNFHVKIAITGCPNDCIKAHLQDFGIIGMTEPQYIYNNCIGCEACVKVCTKSVTGALSLHNHKIKKDHRRCIGCGECILKCPTSAWVRSEKTFFRLIILGRTGKKNPRLATTFLNWATEDVVIQVIKNIYALIDKEIDKSLAKEHVGYIIDRIGFNVFKAAVLKNVTLNKEIKVAQTLVFMGYQYEKDVFMNLLPHSTF
ncbi:MAG: sulfite reductase subunit C [Oligoflexia bacterium]|nr:sulfite reductase subunit C [Oligoflexia bacterium]